MKRVLVIGCPGAGKSTFARSLSRITGLPLCHLDLIWHKPDRTNVTREVFDARLEAILSEETWIIDGNYGRTVSRRLAFADTVFFFDLPVEECLAGAEARIGTKRADLPWIEETLDPEFREWILHFPTEELPKLYRRLEGFEGETVIFHSRSEGENYLRALKKKNGERV